MADATGGQLCWRPKVSRLVVAACDLASPDRALAQTKRLSLKDPVPAALTNSTKWQVKGHRRIHTRDESESLVERLRLFIFCIYQ
jgi:hypothetical protein